MATLSSSFKVFYFPMDSDFEQFYNDHPEIKQIRALILETKDHGHFALSNDVDFVNLINEHKVYNEPNEIVLHQVCVNDIGSEYCGVHFTYKDTPDKSYFIAGPRYEVEATNKDLLSETLANNFQKVIWFTNINNEYIMADVSTINKEYAIADISTYVADKQS